MRFAAALALGLVVGLAIARRGPRSCVTPDAEEEAASSPTAAPEPAMLPARDAVGAVRARLLRSPTAVSSSDSKPRAVDDVFEGVPANPGGAPFGLHPESAAAEGSRGLRYGVVACAEDVGDLVEPNGPYRIDAFERWIRDLVAHDTESEIAVRDGKVEGSATEHDLSRVREFLAVQRRRFAPAPPTDASLGTFFNDGGVSYSRDFEYDVEVAQPAVVRIVELPTVAVPVPPAEKGPAGP